MRWPESLTPPHFDDPQQMRRARLLNAVILILAANTIVFGAGSVIIGELDRFDGVLIVAALACYAVTRALLWARRLNAAAVVLLVTMWAILTASGLRSTTLLGTSVGLYVSLIFCAGLLLSKRDGLRYAGLIVLTATVVLAGRLTGLISPGTVEHQMIWQWLSVAISVLAAAGFMYYSIEQTDHALARTLRNEAELADANRRLTSEVAERVQAEQALRHSERRYELAVRAGQAGVWDWELDTGVMFIDPLLKQALGYEDSEIPNRIEAWLGHVHPDDVALVDQALQAHLSGAEPRFECTHRMLHRDGSVRWIQAGGKAVLGPEGRPIRMVGTDIDVTERRRAQDDLVYQARLLENVSDAIISVSVDSTVQSWNAAAARIYGWQAHEVIGRKLGDFLATTYTDGSIRETAMQRILATGSWRGEVIQPHRDGHPVHIMSSVTLLRDGRGQPTGMVAVNRDITQQKAAEDQVRFQAQLLDNVRESVLATDLDGRITYWGRGAALLYGHSAESVLNQPLAAVTPGEDHLPQARAAGQWHGGFAHRAPDGQALWVERTLSLVRDDAGQPRGFVIIDRDTTKRREAEEALAWRVQFESLLTQVLLSFINVAPADFDGAIAAALARFGRFLNADRTVVVAFTPHATIQVTHSWHTPAVVPPDVPPHGIPVGDLPWFTSTLLAGHTVYVRTPDDLPPDADAERAFLRTHNLHAHVAVPLVADQSVIGYVGLNAYSDQHGWTDDLVAQLDLVGQVFANAFARQRVLEALRESEARYRNFIANSSEGIWRMEFRAPIATTLTAAQQVDAIYDHAFHAEANDAYLAQYGFASLADLQATPLGDQMTRSDPHNIAVLRRFIENGYRAVNVETHERDCAGRVKAFLVTANGNVENDRLVSIWGLQTDITDRIRAEETLRESENQYRTLFKAAERQAQELALLDRVRNALAPELNLNTIMRTVVEAISDVFGYTLVSIYLLDDARLVLQHAVGYDSVIRELSIDRGVMGEVVRTGQPILLEDVRRHPTFVAAIDGIISEVCVPLHDGDAVVGVLNVETVHDVVLGERDLQLVIALSKHIDIAIERARLYTAVRESERRFRALIENSSDSVSLVSAEGTVIYTSPVTTRLLGYAPDDIIGQTALALAHPDDIDAAGQVLGRLLTEPNLVQRMTLRVRHLDGDWRWIETVSSNLLHEPGVGALVINFRDVTERLRAEEALRQAQKLESLGIMSGGIAHDFNNLLTAMLAQSSLAQAKVPPDSPARAHIAKMVTAAERAANLTQQLLAYSGRGQFEIQPIDLNALIEENLHLVEVAVPKHIVFRPNLAPHIPLIDGDTGQIQQVLMNLIINAAEAIGDRSGTVSVATGVRIITAATPVMLPYSSQLLQPGDYVTVDVADTGSGMDSATVSRIFDPFFTTKTTGRGLGLAAVLGIVRGHGGGLQVDSRPGHGTTFRVYLPASPRPPAPPSAAGDKAAAVAANVLVLVIDDEAPVRDAIVDALAMGGIATVAAADGQSGVELFRARRAEIGLILLDLSMPGLNGEETLRRLRAVDPRVPVVLSSGYSESATGARYADLPVDGFLQKPYRWNELLNTVRGHLRPTNGAPGA